MPNNRLPVDPAMQLSGAGLGQLAPSSFGLTSDVATMSLTVNTTAYTFNNQSAPSPSRIWELFNVTQEDIDYMATTSIASQTVNRPYCGEEWRDFRASFIAFHGIASTIVCIFGLITNILNIIVLTRKDMVSATNSILTGLAVADMLVMIDYLPFTLHTYVLTEMDDCARYSYGWAVFTQFHANFSVVCHTISIGLTVTLAVWRFIAVTFPQNNRDWCCHQRALVAITTCYVIPPIFCCPVYLCFEIQETQDGCAEGMFTLSLSGVAKQHNGLLQKINFWVYSVLIKIIPCVALTVLSLWLIRALYQTNKRRLLLQMRAQDNADRSCDRTTRMLLAVLLLFLLTEVPQGILALLSGLLGETFFESCYNALSEVMDLLALINSAINFILYCVMSRQFRNTFSHLFKPSILNNWIAIPQEATTQATTCV